MHDSDGIHHGSTGEDAMGWLGDDRRTRAAWLRYGAALLLVLAASLASILPQDRLTPAPVVIFLAAVAVSAWFGGTGPAVAAIALSLVSISLVSLEPLGSWSLGEPDLSELGVFALVSALLVILSDRRDRAEAALQAREEELRGALEQAKRAEATVLQARARAEALAEATRALTEASPGPDAVLAAVARQAAQFGDLAVVRLLSGDGRWLEPVAVDHPDPAAREAAAAALASERHPADQGANGAARQTGSAQRLGEAALTAGRHEGPVHLWPPLPAAPTAALLVAPLRADGRAIGTLSVSRAASDHPYVAEDERFLQELADRAGLAIERARLFDRIRASEERIRLAIEANRMVTWEWEPATDRTTVSDNFPAIYGLPALAGSAEGVALVWPEDRPAHQEKVLRITREGGEYQSHFRITRPSDGETRWMEERAATLTDDAGGVARVVGVVTDVTERQRSEAALRASEERLSALLDQLPIGVGLTDEQGRWVQTNAMLRRFVGGTIASRDPDVRPRWGAWDETGKPIAPSHWPAARALRGETVLGMDFLYATETGEEVWTRVSAAPFRDAAGEVVGAISAIQDIDARKRAEEALAASEAHARFLAEASAVLAETLDYDDAVERVVHLAVPDLADWCVVDLLGADGALHRLAIVHGDPARAATAAELRRRYPTIPPDADHTAWTVLHTRQSWFDPDVNQTRFVAEARDDPHLELLRRLGFESELVTPLVARGEALGVLTLVNGDSGRHYGPKDVALAEDLARHCALAIDNARLYREATAAEAKLRRLFDAGVIGLLIADTERVVEANDRMLEMVGYGRNDLEAERLRWDEMTPPEYAHLDAAAIAEIAERGSCTPFEKEYFRKDGSRVPILIGAAELERDPPVWIGAVLDLTAQRAAEEDRVAFVDAATHDLKNPLTSLKGRVQLLLRRVRRDGIMDAAQLESGLTAIDADADRMVSLIGELMDAAHLRTGRALTLNLDAVDLVALVQRCADETGRRSPLHTIAVDTAEPALVGAWDPSRLERVVQNLLDNAVKYSPRGGRVLARVSREDDANATGWAALSVVDKGVGIPAADLPHIFERFRRGGNVGEIAGAGIGLSGVRQIVIQHGGTVAAESAEGEGTTFTVRLPLLAG